MDKKNDSRQKGKAIQSNIKARITIDLIQNPGEPSQLSINHPLDIILALNMMFDATRMMTLSKIPKPAPFEIPKGNLNLVNLN